MITVCGRKITIKEVRAIEPVTPPHAGRRWAPVRHGHLVDAIVAEVEMRGWGVTDMRFGLGRDGADLAGAFMLNNVTGVVVPAGAELSLGFINSNSRRYALHLTVGANIMCCTNGLCTDSILVNRMHDHTVSLEDELRAAMNEYTPEAMKVQGLVDRLRGRTLVRGEAAEFLLEAGRRRLLGWAAIGRIDAEYLRPRFAEHGKGTAWALLNAFTYIGRTHVHPTRQMATYDTFRDIIMEQ